MLKKKLAIFSLCLASLAPIVTPLATSPVMAATTIKNGFYTENGVQQYYQNNKKVTSTGFVKGKTDWWLYRNGE